MVKSIDKENQVPNQGKTNPRVDTDGLTNAMGKMNVSQSKTYGKHATMPILAADQYAEVILPDLTEFNPEEIKLDGTVVAVGKRRTGKSWVFRNLMYLMKDKYQLA